MLKKYKNGFINLIKEAGLSTENFKAYEEEDSYGEYFKIEYSTGPFEFRIYENEDSYHSFNCFFQKFCPSGDFEESNYGISIEEVYVCFGGWLEKHVKEYFNELLEPDLWDSIHPSEQLVSGNVISEEELQNFADSEKLQINLLINEFRLAIEQNFNPTQEQMNIIAGRLDYLGKGLDRLNRLDWRSLLLNSLISISIALSLNNEQGKVLYELFKQIFMKAIYLLQ